MPLYEYMSGAEDTARCALNTNKPSMFPINQQGCITMISVNYQHTKICQIQQLARYKVVRTSLVLK